MSQVLLVVAASIYVTLGSLHGAFTLQDLVRPTSFTPRDPALREAMQASGIAFHPEVNLWKAWLGFNLTHSLGLFVFGAALLYAGLAHPDLYRTSRLLQLTAILVSATYFAISSRLFFSHPTMATGAATLCFLAAALL